MKIMNPVHGGTDNMRMMFLGNTGRAGMGRRRVVGGRWLLMGWLAGCLLAEGRVLGQAPAEAPAEASAQPVSPA